MWCVVAACLLRISRAVEQLVLQRIHVHYCISTVSIAHLLMRKNPQIDNRRNRWSTDIPTKNKQVDIQSTNKQTNSPEGQANSVEDVVEGQYFPAVHLVQDNDFFTA